MKKLILSLVALMCLTMVQAAEQFVSFVKHADAVNITNATIGYSENEYEGVKIAKIAKVREKLSDGDQEFETIEDAEEQVKDEPTEGEASIIVDNEEDEKVTLPVEEEE